MKKYFIDVFRKNPTDDTSYEMPVLSLRPKSDTQYTISLASVEKMYSQEKYTIKSGLFSNEETGC